ncbi:lysoplasmalogenase [Bacillus sp. KH172YL63]|uniref:lysoplasmalogenase n=1 Tax=Bacillus sp. KH172YL63 TaxID=2709784 RepID=UPI0013E50C82|nr:lysoplasmalogenase [Bacillus sp. KH172YL63]BCB03987.1 membrane protein [Bacillus sp. KH172YL63]
MGKNMQLPMIIALMAILYIFIMPSEPQWLKIVFKLIPMALILLFAFRERSGKTRAVRFVLIGLIFCMLGDGLIAVSFLPGLGAFLIGHLFYVAGFLHRMEFSAIRLAAILPIGIYSFIVGSQLIQSLQTDGNGGLVVPVFFYLLVISLMAWTAIMTGNVWAACGAILFVISDSILSWNMFVSSIAYADILIMATYYAAQFLIAKSLATVRKGSKNLRQAI